MSHVLITIIELIYAITIINIVIVVISENRNPIKTLSWVMVLIFLPVIGVIWYLIFGQDVTKKQIISKRMYSKLKKRPLNEFDTQEELICTEKHANLIHLLQNMDHTPLLSGNNIQFFTKGDEHFDQLIADIENAKEHIHIEYYIISDDKLGNRIKEALIEKSLQGVEVRIIYDSFGSRKTKKSFFEDLRKAGIESEPFLKLVFPIFTARLNYRNHRKIVVIDGKIGYLGGMNIANRYIEGCSWGIWRDTQIRIEGKGVQGLQSIFLIDWHFVSKTLITSRKYFPELEKQGDIVMQTVNSGPLREDKEISHGILQAIYDAKKSIYIQTPYFIPPESMSQALQAAAIRGVDVRVMISEYSDMRVVQYASKSYVKEMLQSGVRVFCYQKGFLHSKLMVFDDSLTLIGSVNFDSRSFEQNFEVEGFIYDNKVAKEAIEIFLEDEKYAKELLLKDWLKRPRAKRFIESFMRLFAPLI